MTPPMSTPACKQTPFFRPAYRTAILPIFLLGASLFLATGCQDSAGASDAADGATKQALPNQEGARHAAPDLVVKTDAPAVDEAASSAKATVTVGTAQEFINAIGSDRTIIVKPGTYYLCEVPDTYMDHVRWDQTTAGKTVTIRKVKNLHITGSDMSQVNILVRPYSVYVLNFEDCSNCQVSGLTFGHAPDKGSCESGVIGLKNCRDMLIDRCDLFGCGTEGLTIDECVGLTVTKSIIRECSYGIMTIKGSKELRFADCKIHQNEKYYGVQIHDSKDIAFTSCSFTNNVAQDPLFNVVSSAAINVKACAFDKNTVPARASKGSAVSFIAE